MKKTSTPSTPSDNSSQRSAAAVSDRPVRPGKLAIAFIRSFARSYHYEPRLAVLGSMSVN